MYYSPYPTPMPSIPNVRRPMPTFEEYTEQKELKKYGNKIGLTMICNRIPYLIFSVFTGAFLLFFGFYNSKQSNNGFYGLDPLAYTLLSNLIYAVCLAVPFLLLMRSFREDRDAMLPFQRVGAKTTFFLVLAGLGGSMAINLQTNFLLSLGSMFGLPVPNMEQPFVDDVFYLILSSVMTALLPAILEEFVFRGVILGSLRRFGDSFAIIVSACLFALTHFYLPQLPIAFVLGLTFAFLVVKTNSLLPGILIHFFNNFYASFADVILQKMNNVTVNLIYLLSMVILIIIGGLAIWRLFKSRREFFELPSKGNSALSLGKRLKVFCSSPGIICLLILLSLCVIVFTASIL